jgi:hypothetical protein
MFGTSGMGTVSRWRTVPTALDKYFHICVAGLWCVACLEMMSWSLEQITLAGYYKEIGVEPEINLRQPEQIRARLHPAT